MKNKTSIIALFILLLVFPTSTVLAFGNSSKTPKTENHICSSQDTHSGKKSCCDNDDNGCVGLCNNNYCHFPNSVSIPFYINDSEQTSTTLMYVLKVDYSYVQNTPNKVYLSIWQPPEIS
jgi:predicted acylesterase/phospholipase RssA